MCVPCSHVNRTIIHVKESIHLEGLALLAGDDGQAFQGTSEGWKEGGGRQMVGKEGLEQKNPQTPLCNSPHKYILTKKERKV